MNKEKYLSRIIPILRDEGLGVSMDVIAERTGISKKTLYNQFSSKDELISVCVGLFQQEFRERLNIFTNSELSVQDGFCKGIEEVRLFFTECSHSFVKDLSQFYPKIARASHIGGFEMFEHQVRLNIERGISEKVYRHDIDAHLLAKYIVVSIFGFFEREVMKNANYSVDHFFSQVIDFNMNALLAR